MTQSLLLLNCAFIPEAIKIHLFQIHSEYINTLCNIFMYNWRKLRNYPCDILSGMTGQPILLKALFKRLISNMHKISNTVCICVRYPIFLNFGLHLKFIFSTCLIDQQVKYCLCLKYKTCHHSWTLKTDKREKIASEKLPKINQVVSLR